MQNQNDVEVRKVQSLVGERSFSIVLPKSYAIALGIGKGDFLKVHMENHKLTLEKAEI
jgi:bifunctional DNA-binding transcriptional regulator/antitoxin component of YhaV-PrlF toxin-antitoxin module